MERLDDLHFDQTITQHGGRVEAGGGGAEIVQAALDSRED
jgi:hypothetical protein